MVSTESKEIVVKHLLDSHRKDVEKQLKYLVNTANRLKLTPPTRSFSDVYEFEFAILLGKHEASGEEEYETYLEKVFDVTINVTETLKMSGSWTFACAIDHRAKVMIQADEELVIPTKYNPSNEKCDHCNKKYPRVKSYIIHNNDDGEFKQVGKGCLKQFLGINPASYITMFEAISHFSPIVEGYGAKNRGGRLENLAYDVKEMLRYAIHQVKKDNKFVKPEWKHEPTGRVFRGGYEETKAVRTNEGEATVDGVRARIFAISFFINNPGIAVNDFTVVQLNERLKHYQKRLSLFDGVLYTDQAWNRTGKIKYTINRINESIKALSYKSLLDENVEDHEEEISKVIAYVQALEVPQEENLQGFDQYKQGLKTVFLKERTLQSNLSTIVSGYGFYLNQMIREENERKRLANAQNLKHVGVVGQKIELELTVTDLKTGEGAYGTWYLWFFEDADGNKFKKFGTVNRKFTVVEADENNTGSDASVGSKIKTLVEMKEHEVYREERVNVLGRMSKSKDKNVKYLNK